MGSSFFWRNKATATAAIITATSSDADFPLAALRLVQRAQRWRSAVGWTIIAGFNDRVDFNRSGVKVATIAAGYYATGDELATAIVTALEAADATPAWACSYNSGTHKFTLSADLAQVLLWSSGTNLARSIGPDLGFAATDSASATSHAADGASYQSRQALLVDLGSALSIEAAFVLDGNATAVRVDGNASALTTAGATGSRTQSLTAGDDIMVATFAASSYRYWRLLLDAVSVSDGYTEVSIAFLGPALTLTYAPTTTQDFVRARRDYSDVGRGRGGTSYANPLSSGRSWQCAYGVLPEAEWESLETAFEEIRRGQPFFWRPRAAVPAETYYVFTEANVGGSRIAAGEGTRWTAGMELQEMIP